MNTAPEVLLTSLQLAQITAAAAEYLLEHEHAGRVVIMGIAATSIQRVSPTSGLILVAGNEHTGMKHIQVRHDLASLRRTWLEYINRHGKRDVRMDDPSRFRLGVSPIFDYITIADAIYLQGVLSTENNRRPTEFEVYEGTYTYSDGIVVPHRLLLYKGTKIIHALIPLKSVPRRKQVSGFLLKRGQASAEWHTASSITKTTIPYSDREGRIRYAVIIYLHSSEQREEAELVKYDAVGQPESYLPLGSQPYEGHIAPDGPSEIFRWQYVDFSALEVIMRDTDKELTT